MKTFRVAYHLVGDLSRALQVDDDEGPSPMDQPVTPARHRTCNILRDELDGIRASERPSDQTLRCETGSEVPSSHSFYFT